MMFALGLDFYAAHVYLLLDSSYIYRATAPTCREPCFAKLEQAMMHAGKTTPN